MGKFSASTSKSKLIVWDMDGVLVKLTERFCELANVRIGSGVCDPQKLKRYGLETYYPRNIVDEIFESEELWLGAKEDEKVFELFKKYEGNSIVCSVPYGAKSAWWKQEWLLSRGVDPKRIVLVGDKSYVATGDRMLIDDTPSRCYEFVRGGGKALLYEQPYSRDADYFTEQELSVSLGNFCSGAECLDEKIAYFLSSQ